MNSKNKGWIRVLLLIIPYLIVVGIFQAIGIFIAGIDFRDIDSIETPLQTLILSFSSLIGTLFLLWLFMKYVDKEKFINLGLHFKNRKTDFVVGIGLGVLVMGIGYELLIFLNEISFEKIVFEPINILISLALFSCVAVMEEVLFRGYVLRNLMISFNKYIALILSSILFSLIHGMNPNMDGFSAMSLFLAGILLGISYIYTKNLWFPIALHLSWNLFQSLFGFNVSGQDFYSLIEFKVQENNLLNGGAFGMEGSIISIIANILIIVGVIIYYNRNKKVSLNEG
jgi:membrane protease YdiL (CAAX protease family)